MHWPHPSTLTTPHSLATPIHPHSQLHTLWPHPETLTHWPHPLTRTQWPHPRPPLATPIDHHWPLPGALIAGRNIFPSIYELQHNSCTCRHLVYIYIYQLQTSYLIHYTSSHSQTTPINPHSLATPIDPHNSARLATTHWLTTNRLTIRYNIAIFNHSVCKCGCRLPTSTLILHSLCAMESSTLSTTTISLPVELWAASPGNQQPCATCRPFYTVYPQ